MNPKPAMADEGSGVLSGLLSKGKQKPQQKQGMYIRTMREDEQLRAGKVPAGWSRHKSGEVRPMVQGGR